MIHKITHSVMFHHFHNDQHLPSQGSLSGSDFIKMIDWLGKKYNLDVPFNRLLYFLIKQLEFSNTL